MHAHKLSPATAIAMLALFFAIGGTAFAAHHYLVTSTSQIKPSVLKALRGQTGPAGPAGQAGATGATGAPGPAGPSNLSTLTTVTGPTVEVLNDTVGVAEAVCPAGSHAVSGGGTGGIAGLDVSEMETTRQSWFVLTNNETGITIKIHAQAQCAGAGQAVAARAPRVTHAREDALLAEIDAELAARRR
jgi:hypothetical protein